jgi:hypothetical protein
LGSEEAEEFRKLLIKNPELIQEVNRLQEVLGLLPYALPQVSPPQHLRSAIVEAVNTPIRPIQSEKLPLQRGVGLLAVLPQYLPLL